MQKKLRALTTWPRQHWKLLIIVVVLILGGWLVLSNRSKASKKERTFVRPTRGQLTETLEVSGVVDAKEKVSLRFASGGKLTYLGAKEGDWISKWQTIARIDARELQKRLQQDLNTYFNERMDYEQGRDDRRDIAPTNTLGRTAQQEQKSLENTVLDVEIRDIAIKNTALTSPISGVLVSAPTSVAGVTLLATDTFEIINPDSLIFKATVDQADVAKVQKGQKVKITLDAYPEETFTSTVTYIAYKSAQSSTGTVYVIEMPISVASTAEQLALLDRFRLGMNGDAKVVLAENTDALSIPLDTTRQRDGKTYVDVRTGAQTTAEREITTGLETETSVEVTRGLTEQDEVLVPQ